MSLYLNKTLTYILIVMILSISVIAQEINDYGNGISGTEADISSQGAYTVITSGTITGIAGGSLVLIENAELVFTGSSALRLNVRGINVQRFDSNALLGTAEDDTELKITSGGEVKTYRLSSGTKFKVSADGSVSFIPGNSGISSATIDGRRINVAGGALTYNPKSGEFRGADGSVFRVPLNAVGTIKITYSGKTLVDAFLPQNSNAYIAGSGGLYIKTVPAGGLNINVGSGYAIQYKKNGVSALLVNPSTSPKPTIDASLVDGQTLELIGNIDTPDKNDDYIFNYRNFDDKTRLIPGRNFPEVENLRVKYSADGTVYDGIVVSNGNQQASTDRGIGHKVSERIANYKEDIIKIQDDAQTEGYAKTIGKRTIEGVSEFATKTLTGISNWFSE